MKSANKSLDSSSFVKGLNQLNLSNIKSTYGTSELKDSQKYIIGDEDRSYHVRI